MFIFRKLKLNAYINKKKHEQKMINKFKHVFGSQEDVIIAFGDWEQKQHMKYKEPTKGKGIRKFFRENGYKVYLVDEYRTSCMCSKCCEGKCEKFITREDPKAYKKCNIIVHGALICKKCNAVWNRDVNGTTNIFRIVKNIIDKKERPKYLCR